MQRVLLVGVVGLLALAAADHAPLQLVQRLRGDFRPPLSSSSCGVADVRAQQRVCASPTMQQQRHRHKMQQQRAASNHARSKVSGSRRPRNSNKHNEPNYLLDDVPHNHWLDTLPALGMSGRSTPTRTSAHRQRRLRSSGRALGSDADADADADSELCSKPAPDIEAAAKLAAAALEPAPDPEVAPPVRAPASVRKPSAAGASKGRLPKQRKAPPLSDALKAQLEA